MKVSEPDRTNALPVYGLSESVTLSVMERRFRQSGIAHYRRTRLIQSLRLTLNVLKEAYFVYALVISLKAGLTLSYLLPLM
jgi:hypothetical protein